MSTGKADNSHRNSTASISDDQALADLRVKIDAADKQIIELLQQRGRLAIEVGDVKGRTGAPVYRPEREAAIYRRMRETQTEPLDGAALESIYRQVISACRGLEKRIGVAYLGPAGTFSEQAALKHFGAAISPTPCASIDEVFRATEAGMSEFGVVPVENSTEGAVNRTLDLMLESPLKICGEILVPVHHCLMSLDSDLSKTTSVCAHPQALAQCAAWLDANLPGVDRVPVASNAEGARQAGENASLAAIAGEPAAQHYGLQITHNGIQDNPGNRTRFAVIGKYLSAASGNDQTSLILSVPDVAGAVHKLIEPLARHQVSMKRFESRPARQSGWEYFFYIDLLGHVDDQNVASALSEIQAFAAYYKVIGSYPRSTDL